MLNKSISASFKFHALPDDTCRLLATWIIAHLDKNGVFYGDPGMVRSQVFPLRDDLNNAQVEAYLRAIEAVRDDEGNRLMFRFKARGRLWQYWPGFDQNQVGLRKDREGTEYPTPPESVPADSAPPPQESGDMPAELRQDSGKTPPKLNLNESNLRVDGEDAAPNGAPPAAARKTQENGKPKKRRPAQADMIIMPENQTMFTALAAAYRMDTNLLTENARARLNVAVKRIRGAGYGVDDIDRAAQHWWHEDYRGKKNNSAPTDTQFFDTLGKLKAGQGKVETQELGLCE